MSDSSGSEPRRKKVEAPGESGIDFDEGVEIKAVAVGVSLEGPGTKAERARKRAIAREELGELEALLDTLGAEVVATLQKTRKKFDSRNFIGKGNALALKALMEENDADVAVFDDDLTPAQNRNLEKLLCKTVMDRTGVILEIFSRHARTATAKLQVELAHMNYLLPRLKRAWTHLSRQKGAVTMRGVGEKQIELDRRIIRTRIAGLETRIRKLDIQRETRREGRKNMFKVALVGYTNSGKSTLMNALTEAEVLVADQLFATLDSTVRKLTDSRGVPVMISDTVGFIRKLPHTLVESFKSTFEEADDADLLLEVIDLSSPAWERQKKATEEVLEELGMGDKPRLIVFNKKDLLPERSKLPAIVRSIHDPSVVVSGFTGEGLEELTDSIRHWFDGNLEERTLELEAREGAVLSEIYDHAFVESVEYREDGVVEVRFRASPREHDSIDRLLGRSR